MTTQISIETERLRLRPLEPRDAEAHIAMMQDPAVAAYLTVGGVPEDYMKCWRQFASYLGHWSMRGYGFFSVEEKATGRWVGRVGPWQPGGWPDFEVGWAIVSSAWGQGYAPEAARASCQWAFDTYPELSRIVSLIDPKNVNSQAVARKIGEAKTDEVFEVWGLKLDIWAVERSAWTSRTNRTT